MNPIRIEKFPHLCYTSLLFFGGMAAIGTLVGLNSFLEYDVFLKNVFLIAIVVIGFGLVWVIVIKKLSKYF